MTVRTYAELLVLLADNTTGQISPQDMRDVIDSLSLRYTVGTYAPAGPITTPTTTTRVSLAQYFTAATADLTWNSGFINFRYPGIYQMNTNIQGSFSTGGVMNTVVRYGLNGSAPTTALPFSNATVEANSNNEFNLEKSYLLNITQANITIEMAYYTNAIETWNTPSAFMTIRSLGPTYGGT